ncbi:hypothetical protein [Nakamurella sp.]|uniref:hypothetical protein n=1 Tax=Nakamurella sp. TaxID=1869182 RepID=UPI0037833021
MRSRHALTAALALSVVTILTVAACGSSVQGSAQVNTAAAESATSAATTSERTSRTSTAAPTDLSDLSSMLNDLSTELSVPDLSVPSDLSDLNIPGYSDTCFAVSIAYLTIVAAPFATLGGGSGQYDASELKQALEDLGNGGQVPPELAQDFATLSQLADRAGGESLSDAEAVFGSPEFATASDNISKWVDANCGGN